MKPTPGSASVCSSQKGTALSNYLSPKVKTSRNAKQGNLASMHGTSNNNSMTQIRGKTLALGNSYLSNHIDGTDDPLTNSQVTGTNQSHLATDSDVNRRFFETVPEFQNHETDMLA